MNWFNRVRNSLGFGADKKTNEKDLWIKCKSCQEMLFVQEYEDNLSVCPKCDHHGRINADTRLALLLDGEADPPRPIAVIPLGAAAETAALPLAERLRRGGFSVDLGYRGNLKRRMNRANKINARAAVIIGDDELAQNSATLRDLDSGEQTLVSLDALDGRLASIV